MYLHPITIATALLACLPYTSAKEVGKSAWKASSSQKEAVIKPLSQGCNDFSDTLSKGLKLNNYNSNVNCQLFVGERCKGGTATSFAQVRSIHCQ